MHHPSDFNSIMFKETSIVEQIVHLQPALTSAFVTAVDRTQDTTPVSYKTRLLHSFRRDKRSISGLSQLHKLTEISLTQYDSLVN